MPPEKAAAWKATFDEVLLTAHDAAFRMTDMELSSELARRLGRLTVARLTGTPDGNTVSRWSRGRNSAGDARLDRMRYAAYLLNALVGLGFSESSARHWFRGPHPALEDEKPMDVIARGDFKLVLMALRGHSPRDSRRAARTLPLADESAYRDYTVDLTC